MAPRILVAEDDDIQGNVLLAALRDRGYEANIVTDGLEAVHQLRTGNYDLALLDYNLPEVDGLAAARLLNEFPGDGNRPRLIAITAAVDRLQQKVIVSGDQSFDAVISKGVGLPVMLAVIEHNITLAAEHNVTRLLARDREIAFQTAALRRQRLRIPIAALPAFAMAAAFSLAFYWITVSLGHVSTVVEATNRTAALSSNATDLIGAVHDAETSQRTYLATGLQKNKDTFEADAQRVDRLLVGAAPLTLDGSPGITEAAAPHALIEPLLKTLAEEAKIRSRVTAEGIEIKSQGMGRETSSRLLEWKEYLLNGSLGIALVSSEAVRKNVGFVLVVLAMGILYGFWNAGFSMLRQWRATAPLLSLCSTSKQVMASAPSGVTIEGNLV